MTVPARITLLTLGVTDLDRSVAFYEALGWRRSSMSQESVAFFHTTGPVLALFGHAALAEDAQLPVAPPPRDFRGVSLAINLESEAEVDRVMAEAEAAGATILKPAERVFWGGYSGYFADPDDHAWEVAHNPYIPFLENGLLDLPD